MNNKIDKLFDKLKVDKSIALIPFVPINWPSKEDTVSIVETALNAGAHAIELGIPFSDPLADGTTNQNAYQEALKNGANINSLFQIVKKLRNNKIEKPIIAFSYYNPIYKFGTELFLKQAQESGLDGVIVVDLPPEESQKFSILAKKYNLHQIYLLAPTSDMNRIKLVAKQATGFIYCVSVSGTTGVREDFSDELINFISQVKKQTDLPIAIGFGVSKKKHIDFIANIADGAIVGSAFVENIRNSSSADRSFKISEFVKNLVEVNEN
ncbi:MAG: tryptophan synthase subunit alpha [Dehalococcoidia bacterium]|nr:tryptophan synthase subunit alpha [Dehalococcoidia bacterium]